MSNTIDERVVEMRFDNSHFESNVKTTMSTLDKLKQKLNFPGASKGLEDVESASKKVKLIGLSNAIDSVNAKFSALQVIGMTALANITNSAINAGKQIAASLTIEPVKTGFQEYETQINAIQTILANTQSKGSTLDDVNRALDELNKYADLTIYNFTEMTRNIGTFTAAGVDLETSVSSIQGIANLAAISGSTSQQASTAMYQLSQALAAGTVKLMDWNSVVNAGMGGQVFQDALKRTATVMGTNVDAIIEKVGSFRESLSAGWITSEVLTETLNQFTLAAEEGTEQWEAYKASLKEKGYTEEQAIEILKMANTATDAATKVKTFTQLMDTLKEAAQSGWTQTWELLIGDFEGAKNLFGSIYETLSDVINESAEARNSMLKDALSSNWERLEDQIVATGISMNDFQEKIKVTAREHNIAVDDIIEEEGSLSNAFKNGKLSGNLIIDTLKNYINGLDETSTAVSVTTDKIEEFREQVLKAINGDFGNGAERIKAFADAGMDYATVQDIVNEVFADGVINYDALEKSLSNMSVTQIKSIGYTEEQAEALKKLAEEAEKTGTPLNELIQNLSKPSGRELLIDSVKNALNGLVGIIRIVRSSWQQFLGMDSGGLYNIISGINNLSKCLILTNSETGELTETGEKLKRTFDGLFAIVDIITNVIGGAFTTAIKIICDLFGMTNVSILDITAGFGDLLVNFHKFVSENNLITEGFNLLITTVSSVISKIKEFIFPDQIKSISELGETATDAATKLEAFWQLIVTIAESVQTNLSDTIDQLKTKVSETYGVGTNFIEGFINGIRDGNIDIVSVVIELGKKILNDFRKILGIESPSKESYSDGQNYVQGFINGVTSFASKATQTITEFGKQCLEAFQKIDFGPIISAGISIGMVALIKKISDTLKTFSSPIEDVSEVIGNTAIVVKNFGKLLKSGSKAINAFAAQTRSKALLNTALALATLVGSIALLAHLVGNDAQAVNDALIVIAALSAVLITLSAAMKIVGGVGSLKGGGTLVLIAGAMLMLTKIAKQLGSMTESEIRQGGAFIVGFTAIIGALMYMSNLWGVNGKDVGINLLAISGAFLLLAKTAKILGSMTESEIGQGWTFIIAFTAIIGALMYMSKRWSANGKDVGINLLAISGAFLLLAETAKILGSLTESEIWNGFIGLVALTAVIGALMAIVNRYGKEGGKIGTTLLAISAAMGILAAIAVVLGLLPVEHLIKGVAAVSVLGIIMSLMIAATKGAEKCVGNIVAMSIAIGVMAAAVAALSIIKTEQLIPAAGALAVLMGMFAVMTKMADAAKGSMSTLIILTVVVGALGTILYLLQDLPVESVIGTAGALTILLLSLSVAMMIISNLQAPSGKALLGMAALTAVIAALGIILYILQGLPIESVIGTAAALSLLLISLSAAASIMSSIGNIDLKAIGSLIAMAAAISILVPAFKSLGEMSFGEIGAGLLALAGTLTVLGVAGALLGPIAPAILMLAGAIALLGVGCAAVGAGVLMLSAGLSSLSVSGVAGAAALSSAVMIIIGLIPILLQQFGNGIIALAGVITNGAPAIASAMTAIIVSISSAIAKSAPAIATAVTAVITSMALAISACVPIIIKTVGTVLSALIKFIATYVPQLIELGMTLLLSLLEGIANNIGEVVSTAFDIMIAFLNAISQKLPGLIQAGIEVMISFINGMADGIRNNTSSMIDATNNLMDAIVGAIVAWFSNIVEKGKEIVVNIASGISENASEALSAAKDLVSDIVGGITEKVSDFTDAAKNLIDGFIQGIKDNVSSAVNAIGDFANDVVESFKDLLGIHSPSRVFRDEIGKYIVDGLAAGITNTVSAEKAAIKKADSILKAFNDRLEIHSPSVVFEEESGKYIIEGLKKGITEDTSAEDAAAKMADNITKAVADKFEELDILGTLFNLESAKPEGASDFIDKLLREEYKYLDGTYVEKLEAIRIDIKRQKKEVAKLAADLLEPIADEHPSERTEYWFAQYRYSKAEEDYNNAIHHGFDHTRDTDKFGSGYSTDRLDLNEETLNLKQQLFDDIDDEEAYIDKRNMQLKRIANALEEYEKQGRIMGITSTQAQEAYNAWLQEQIDLKTLDEEYAQSLKDKEKAVEEAKLAICDLDDETQDLLTELYGESDDSFSRRRIRQLERVTIAQKAFNDAVADYGESSAEAKKAYNALLQEQVDLKNLDDAYNEELENKKYQHSIDWINKKKEANELSLFDELAAYKRVQARYEEGSEKRIELDKEVARVEQEIADANKSYYEEVEKIHEDYIDKKKQLDKEYNDEITKSNEKLEKDIKEIWDSYYDSVASRADAIYDSFGLFDAVDNEKVVDGSTLLNNLQSQVDALENWSKELNKLQAKGVGKGLIEELRAMGPKSTAEIKALNSLSNAELTQYKRLWNKKHTVARKQAEIELTDLRYKSMAQVKMLEVSTADHLIQYRNTWETQIAQLATDTDEQLSQAKSKWLETLKVSDPEKKEVSDSFNKMVIGITTDIGTNTGWSEAGANAVNGIIQGINLNSSMLIAAVSTMMSNALIAAQAVWDINSPSKEFMKIGKFGVRGLALGFIENSNIVTSAVKEVGNEALNGMSDSIAKIVDLVNSGVDTQPTIRPILDLSAVESETNRLNAMFSRDQALKIQSSRTSAKVEDNQNGDASSRGGDTYTFTQNNYSPKALSRPEIYRQTKNQFSAIKRMVKA